MNPKPCLRWSMATTLLCAITVGGAWGQNADSKPQASKPAPTSATGSEVTAPAAAQPAQAVDENFLIGADDVLAISVWKEPDLSRSIPVRSDGKITLPLIGEVQASGKTPRQLQQEIADKLQSFISEPEVTVIVQEIRSQRYNVLGMVAKPGSYMLTKSTTVLDAIAVAGGFRDFAKKKSIYVLRQGPDGAQSRLPFNYKEVVKGKNPEQNVTLKPRDTVVVP